MSMFERFFLLLFTFDHSYFHQNILKETLYGPQSFFVFLTSIGGKTGLKIKHPF